MFSQNDIYVSAGAQYILNIPYTPLIFLQVGKSFNSLQLTASANLHAGGYGGFNIGFNITKQFGTSVVARLGSNSLLGLVAPGLFTGAAGYVGVGVQF